MAEVSFSLPAKRKRGRPRKDGNIFRQGNIQSPENLALIKTQRTEVAYPTPDGTMKTQEADKVSTDGIVDGMVGTMIHGVIEGIFDAGYFISVRISDNTTPFRGVVFEPMKLVPVTAANDVAPQAKMYHRRDIPVPGYDDFSQISGISPQSEKVPLQPGQASKQADVCPILPAMSLSGTPYSVGNPSTFMASESIMLRTGSCSNMGGTVTVPKSPPTGIIQQSPPVQPTGSSIGMLEHHDEESKRNIATMGDMITRSSLKSTNNSFSTAENINQNPQKIAEHRSEQSFSTHNRQNNLDSVEGMPQAAFGIQQDKMSCGEMDRPMEFFHDRQQSPAIELHEISAAAQVHTIPREPQTTRTELQPTDLYYTGLRSTDVNFPQYLLTDQSQPDSRQPKHLDVNFHPGNFVGVSKSPNLKLDLSSSTLSEKNPPQLESQASNKPCIDTNYFALNGLKNPNVGYHQALVSGNPLLLPPDVVDTSLSVNKSSQETNLELESRFAGTHERNHGTGGTGDSTNNTEADPAASPYKLELAAPQSNINKETTSGGCISTYMDLVLGDVQLTEPHDQQK